MWCLMWRLAATQQRVDSDLETIKCRIFGVASISKPYHARRVFPIDISIIHSFLQHNYEEKTTSEILRDHAMQQCVIVSWLRKLISPLTAATRRDDTGDDDERWRDDYGDHVCTSKRGLSFQWGDKMLNSSVVNEILINFIKFYIRESFQFHRSSHVISNRFASPRDWDVNFAAVLRESLFRLVMWNYCFSLSRYPLLLLGWWDDCDSSRGKGQNLKLTSMKCKSLSTSSRWIHWQQE